MKIEKAILASVGFLFLSPIGHSVESGWREDAAAYLQEGRATLNELALENPNVQHIVSRIDVMLGLLPAVLEKYSAARPMCREQLTSIMRLLPELNQWSPKEIRLKIEMGQGLPQAEGCYAARDVVAHPAIVSAVLRRDPLDARLQVRMAREMAEAVEHMEEIEQILE